MYKRFNIHRRKAKSTAPKPLSRDDLDKLGLDVDHFYHRFVELGSDRCPNCGHTDFEIHWLYSKKPGGWRWGCVECGQDWREPHLNLSKAARLNVREIPRPEIMITHQDFVESEYPDGYVRKYK